MANANTKLRSAPLHLRVTPYPDEPLLGFVARLAERNGLDATTWVYEMVGWRRTLLDVSNEPLGLLSAISGVAEERLAWAAQGSTGEGNRRRFFGDTVYRDQLFYFRRRVCTACFAEAPYQRAAWMLDGQDWCPRHRVRLRCACHMCGIDYSWWIPCVRTCAACGADQAGAAAQPAPPGISGFLDEVGRRLEAACDGGDLEVWGLPLRDALRLWRFLGRLDDIADGGRGDDGTPRDLSFLARGHALAAAWPNGFFDLLDRARARAKLENWGRQAQRNHGVHKEFGVTFWSALGAVRSNPVLRGIIFPALETYQASARFHMWRKKAVKAGSSAIETATIPLTSVARSLRLVGPTVRALCETLGIQVHTIPAKGRWSEYSFINKEDLGKLKEMAQHMCSRREASRMLGVKEVEMEGICTAGMLKAYPGENGRQPKFDRREVRAWCCSE